MNVFAILYEPASYTLDRNHRVYDRLGIHYCYMNGCSEAKADRSENIEALNNLTLLALLKTLASILRNHSVVIMNGYTGRTFRWLYVLNLWYRRIIAIDSDTPLNIPVHPLKKLIKRLYLSSLFRDPKMYGLPGGTGSHFDLFRHYGMNDDRIFLMPMMVDNDKFRNPFPRQSHQPFRFLYVGRIVDVKNIPIMVDAFISAFGSNPIAELRIVGTGRLLSSFKRRYAHHSQVTFAGPRYGDELCVEYAQADAFILPSSFEPWGLVVNEAMSAGLPVIVSDCVGAAHDLVENNNTGYVFKHGDLEDLISKMTLLATDPILYKRMSENAAQFMASQWNYEFYTRCLTDFLRACKEK